jgi:diguanylate cyclase (GGDEF)-like protein
MHPATAARVAELVDDCWRLIYIDPQREAHIAAHVVALTEGAPLHPLRAPALFHLAFGLLRTGDREGAEQAETQAREIYAAQRDETGLALCDEVRAVRLRLGGDVERAFALSQALGVRSGIEPSAVQRYMHHNSFANAASGLGRIDEALQAYYRAYAAATEVKESPGALINACVNLGGYHCDLFNFDDAITLLREAQQLALAHRAPAALTFACVNLMQAYDGAELHEQARELAEFMCAHEAALQPGALQRFAVTVAVGHLNAGDIDEAQRWLERGTSALIGAEGDMLTEWANCQARCHLARGDAAAARRVAEGRLAECEEAELYTTPQMAWRLVQVATDACEALGDAVAALRYLRQAQSLYEALVGRSSRARFIALQVAQQIEQAQRERDLARQAHATSELDRARLAELNAALQAKIAEAEALHAQLREQALRDTLTGLHNRRFLFEAGPAAIKLAQRQDEPLAIALLDLDHFKRLNDSHGHDLGDRALRATAALLAQRLRASDIVCRHGGEEFVLLLPGASADEARRLLDERLRELGELSLALPGAAPVQGLSFSAGVAALGPDGDSLEALLKSADARLYAAKAAGRARVMTTDA